MRAQVWKVVLCCLVIAVVAATAENKPPDPWQEHRDDLIAAYKAGRYAEATKLGDVILAAKKPLGNAGEAMAEALLASGGQDRACKLLCDGTAEATSTNLLDRAGMALHCGNAKQQELAICALKRAVALDPASTHLAFNLTVAYWNAGYVDEASQWCRKILEKDPANVQALQILERAEKRNFYRVLDPVKNARRKVVFRMKGKPTDRPVLSGSWDAHGKFDQFRGWTERPMMRVAEEDPAVFTAEQELDTDKGRWYSAMVRLLPEGAPLPSAAPVPAASGDASPSASPSAAASPSPGLSLNSLLNAATGASPAPEAPTGPLTPLGPVAGAKYLSRFPMYPTTSATLEVWLDESPIQTPTGFLAPRAPVEPSGAPAGAAPRTILICIDSATWNIVMPLVRSGAMPQLRRIMEQGSFSAIHSDPPISTIAFDRINFGKAGTFGWMDWVKDSIETLKERGINLIQSPGIAGAENVWKQFAAKGISTLYISWAEEIAYDAKAKETVEDYHVSADDVDVGGQTPPKLEPRLHEFLDWRAVPGPEKPTYSDQIVIDLVGSGLKRFGESMHLLKKHKPQLTFVHFGFIDTSFHLLWEAMDSDLPFLKAGQKINPRHRLAIAHLHRMMDLFIGEYAREIQSQGGNVIVFSDHGATGGFASTWLGHEPIGILLGTGPSFQQGVTQEPPPDIDDLVPTLRAIYKVPQDGVYKGTPMKALKP